MTDSAWSAGTVAALAVEAECGYCVLLMSEHLRQRILDHIRKPGYRPQQRRALARQLGLESDENYGPFKNALGQLIQSGMATRGPRNTVVAGMNEQEQERTMKDQKRKSIHPATKAPPSSTRSTSVVGMYRHNRRGFGFVIPIDPPGHPDLFIPSGEDGGAITGDTVRAQITNSHRREGQLRFEGRITEIVERTNARFVGTLMKQAGGRADGPAASPQWMVLPDGNDFTEPIITPDAGSRHIKAGTKVVVELTQYPRGLVKAQGVITEVLGHPSEKDVDLKSILVQYNLPGEFPEDCRHQARVSLDRFNATLEAEMRRREDLTREIICTIDPDDAKDYDDAISLKRLSGGNWELGVHIADVSYFVPPETPLDDEASKRGNSVYLPGFVVPMLPEILSNGVCSLQEGVPRLCKSAFIEIDDGGYPVSTRFANSVIRSARRLRYREAQAIIDGLETIPHPDGPRSISEYPQEVVQHLGAMNELARRIQKRRLEAGQLVLSLPQVELVLDEEGKVVGAEPEDESFTHTLIEMFMVEANEAVARLLNGLDVPFLRRIHPEPEGESAERLRHFVQVAGHALPKTVDRKALQGLLAQVKGKPEAFAINLAVLKSLTRAEYSPRNVGHYALASEQYCHFTSPIRRYADLTVHRLLDEYFAARELQKSPRAPRRGDARDGHKLSMQNVISHEDLLDIGKHISFTERRAGEAENELKQVKVLELLRERIGDEFPGVVTGITRFGIFIQLQEYLVDGLIRYEDLMGDHWDVDERSGVIHGRRSNTRIRIGDVVKVLVAAVDVPRRELTLAISELVGRRGGAAPAAKKPKKSKGTRPDRGGGRRDGRRR